jgi:hypothetical protein
MYYERGLEGGLPYSVAGQTVTGSFGYAEFFRTGR